MEHRELGRSELRLSAVGLGCMGMSGIYGVADEHESIATIRRAVELGVVFLDTSDAYGNGHNEELVGRAIRGMRDRVVLTTKFGQVRDDHGHLTAIDGSTDHVDLYFQPIRWKYTDVTRRTSRPSARPRHRPESGPL